MADVKGLNWKEHFLLERKKDPYHQMGNVIELFSINDEYLATPNNYPTHIRMRAFESFSWDELNGGHVSIFIDK